VSSATCELVLKRVEKTNAYAPPADAARPGAPTMTRGGWKLVLENDKATEEPKEAPLAPSDALSTAR
jgi:hypothetical protein